MSDKLIGKTVAGRFVIEELLGTGATGAVYKAQQSSVDRVVAVKTLHPFLQEREDFKARFEIEAKAIARLNHPNCITLYDFGYDEEFDVFYMAVEFIKGRLLADMMSEGISSDDVLAIGYQVAEALEHAHREGILHRDLKPENIMIEVRPESGRYVVKVLDFGLARLYEAAPQPGDDGPSGRYKQITEVGQVYGTPAYMSPEQCRANEDLTPATDIYALGTMLYELLQGELPFFSKSTAELIMMQMTDDPPMMDRIDVGPDLKNLVFSMMQKDPEARPQTAREVLNALMPYVRLDASQEFRIPSGEHLRPTPEQLTALGAPPTLARPSQEIAPTPTLELSSDELTSATSTPKAAIWLAVAAVVVVIGIGVMSLSPNDAEQTEPQAVSAIEEPSATEAAQAEDGNEPTAAEEHAANAASEDAEPAASTKKPSTDRKKTSKAEPKDAEPKQVAKTPSEGSTTSSPRAKTLKLTY